MNPRKIGPDALSRDQRTPRFDAARALADVERKDPKISGHLDQQMTVAVHENGPLHVHIEKAPVAGPYHLSIYIEGDYCADHDVASGSGHHHPERSHARGGAGIGHRSTSECDADCVREPFVRLLTALVPVAGSKKGPAVKSRGGKRGRASKK